MTEQTTLLMVDQDTTVDALIEKVRQTSTSHVELLFTNGAPALESRKACDRLRETAIRQNIELTFYTDNEAIIRAAQKCQINVVPIDPSALHGDAPATASPSTSKAKAEPLNPEEAFLQSLADVPFENPPSSSDQKLDDINAGDWLATNDDPWASHLDSSAVAASGGEKALREQQQERGGAEDDWFDAFNDFSDTISGNTEGTTAEPPRQRIRAEDIELTSEDLDRQQPRSKRAGATDKKGGSTFPTRMILLALIVIGILAALAWFLFGRNSGDIAVQIAPAAVNQAIIEDVRLIISADPVTDQASDALQGRIVSAPVSVVTRGTISSTSSVPDATATGVVTILNPNTQPYNLPVGTVLATTSLNGEELSYRTTQDVTVPAAQTSFTGTTNGQVDVPVVASAGGEVYNLPVWTEDRAVWAVRGYEGVLFGINNTEIGGGSVRQENIPTQEDIRALLNQALPQLENQAYTQLQATLVQNEQLAGLPLQPPLNTLAENPNLYSVETRPIEGSTNEFELVITAEFRGLAVPSDKPLTQQLERVLPLALQLHSVNFETTQIVSQDLNLVEDNSANLIMADVAVGPRSTNNVLAETQQVEIAQMLAGKSRQEAQAILAELSRTGQIGRYQLPETIEIFPVDPEQIVITEYQGQP